MTAISTRAISRSTCAPEPPLVQPDNQSLLLSARSPDSIQRYAPPARSGSSAPPPPSAAGAPFPSPTTSRYSGACAISPPRAPGAPRSASALPSNIASPTMPRSRVVSLAIAACARTSSIPGATPPFSTSKCSTLAEPRDYAGFKPFGALEEVEAHPGEEGRLPAVGSDEPVGGAVGAFHEQALLDFASQEEVPPEIEIDPGGGASRGAESGIGVDRRDADADAQEGPEEEAVEEIVLERGLADLAERGVLARQPEAHSTVVAAKLERELSLRLCLVEAGVLGEGRDPRHEDQGDVPATLGSHRLRRGAGDAGRWVRPGCGLRVLRVRARLGSRCGRAVVGVARVDEPAITVDAGDVSRQAARDVGRRAGRRIRGGGGSVRIDLPDGGAEQHNSERQHGGLLRVLAQGVPGTGGGHARPVYSPGRGGRRPTRPPSVADYTASTASPRSP